ncbi:MAG TPA: hypothetical protein VG942_12500 [Hyphomonadaceae bacterium]|nr:hypothetical protein [Hyphomonadaceae bacterium]
MIGRCIYIWKLDGVLAAEGGVSKVIEKARRANLSKLWVKVADGATPQGNVIGATGKSFGELVDAAAADNIEVWGWQVPHCASPAQAAMEAATALAQAEKFKLAGLIMDAEGGPGYFQGGLPEAEAYGDAMKAGCQKLKIPLALSSNDIPQNFPGWPPRFAALAQRADYNFPQTYYGGSPSVTNRVDRAVAGNAHVAASFVPVGAGWIGQGDGGCASASACAERAREFIRLCNERKYQGYSFWHWGGAPLALWEVLNTTAV